MMNVWYWLTQVYLEKGPQKSLVDECYDALIQKAEEIISELYSIKTQRYC